MGRALRCCAVVVWCARGVCAFSAPRGGACEPLAGVDTGATPLLAPVDAALPGVFAVPHVGGEEDGGGAYVVPAAKLLVGVPTAAGLEAISAAGHAVETWFVPDRVADAAPQAAVRDAFPGATRVVHRMDAGRGAYRRRDDVLLSAGDDARGRANVSPTARDAGGAGGTTTRKLDDGPWDLGGGLVARWAAGPSLGSCVLRYDVAGGVLFSGRCAGYDRAARAVSAFALEADHSAGAHARSLRDLAEASPEWDVAWLLPSRGAPARFPAPADARDALRAAADAAARLKVGGKN